VNFSLPRTDSSPRQKAMLLTHERATLFAEQSICGKSGAADKWIPAFRRDDE
jgi:hypothetical protein